MGGEKRRATLVTIEISGVCNAQCVYCAQWRLRQEKHFGSAMPAEQFARILDHLLDIGVIDPGVTPPIALFNWGEPFLHPDLNAILESIGGRGLAASISSNFIKKPEIEITNLPIIKQVTFSLSGFSQDTYGRIHGATLEKVLAQFDVFYALMREHSPRTTFVISWHRYTFNEHEVWAACRYFERPGITFNPVVAYLNDGVEFVGYAQGRMPEERLARVRSDIHIDSIDRQLRHFAAKKDTFHCPAWDQLVIDETGNLLLCCTISRYDTDYVLGTVLDLSAEDIWAAKARPQAFCDACIRSGVAQLCYNPDMFLEKPMPSGGGLCMVRSLPRRIIKRLASQVPGGKHLVSALKAIKSKLA